MNSKMIIHTYLLTITVNANGSNVPTKRYMKAEGIRKQDSYTSCLQETPVQKDTKWKQKDGKRYFMKMETNKQKVEVAILIPDKTDFKIKVSDADHPFICLWALCMSPWRSVYSGPSPIF